MRAHISGLMAVHGKGSLLNFSAARVQLFSESLNKGVMT